MPKEELYFSTDVETDGPIPGGYSMLSFGTVVFDSLGTEMGDFTRNLVRLPQSQQHPDTMEWWKKQPEAWKAHRQNVIQPITAMREYIAWVKSFDCIPVFVAYPAGFDWTFMYWYMITFCNESPFGFQAIDMKSFTMALLGTEFKKTTKNAMPPGWFPEKGHNHIALDDAREQGLLFINQLKSSREQFNA